MFPLFQRCGGVLLLTAVSLEAQEIVAEPNLQLFTVMAAIHAAGYDAGADSRELRSVRAEVRQELARRNPSSLTALREFYQSHRLFDPARDLSQYVSLALFLSTPPSFELQLSPANLPPDVADLQEMVPLLAAFYREADVAALWTRHLPAMEQESERYRELLARVIRETNGYLRLDTSGYFNRRFAIYLSPLGAPNQTDARSYGNNYYIVVSPSAELPEEEIRHGWLHYLLDPLPFRHPRVIESKAELRKLTERAPALDPSFRTSFSLLVNESLIRAIQARRSGKDLPAKRRAVQEAMEEGLLLTAYFFDAMEAFEQQPVGLRLYYPEMIDAVSVKQEQERLAKVQFRAQPARVRQENVWSPMEQMARQGEESLARADYEQARQRFEAISQQFGPQPRALYGLAIVASQRKQPELAKQYFTEAAALTADPRLKAWSHIYLGRIHDLEGDREAARAAYSAALAVGDASPDTRAAAEKGLQEGFSPAGAVGSPRPEKQQKTRQRIPLGKQGG